MEKSNCNALFLDMEVDEDDVTVCKQEQGWFVFDMRKLFKLKGQEMHEGNGSLICKVRTCTTMVF